MIEVISTNAELLAGTTVIVVSSRSAGSLSSGMPATSVIEAETGIWSRSVPSSVGVTCTVNTPGEVSVMVPMVMFEVPALLKSAGTHRAGVDVLAEGDGVDDDAADLDRAAVLVIDDAE